MCMSYDTDEVYNIFHACFHDDLFSLGQDQPQLNTFYENFKLDDMQIILELHSSENENSESKETVEELKKETGFFW